ncbi:MAG: hypothetical protein ACI8XO_002757 [Verrucomicrobiales bacterium]|jgi:hypothetical protein
MKRFAALFFLLAGLAHSAEPPANVGLLIEWIQLEHTQANQLIHQFADQPDATALRESLEEKLDAGEAQLIETSYLTSISGQRTRVESHREFWYTTETDIDGPPASFNMKMDLRPRDIWPSTFGLPYLPIQFDIRNVGTFVEIEANIQGTETIELNVAPERTEHLGDRLVGDPTFAISGTVQPTFRVLATQTNVIAENGKDILIDVYTPKTDSDQRLLLIIRANILRVPDAGKIGAKPIQFNELAKGQTLTIDHHSSGCFHNEATRYEFEGKQVKITPVFPDMQTHRIIQLSDRDFKKLDGTLKFYRYVADAGCTTREHISVKLYEDEKLIAEEKYIDGSCTIEEQKGILPLCELERRLK